MITSQLPLLSDADKEVQLAVDLIYLLETNNIDDELALKAIRIVEKDLLNKCAKNKTPHPE